MQQQQRNTILFIVLASLIVFAWMDLKNRFWPAPKPPAKSTEVAKQEGKKDGKDAAAKKDDKKTSKQESTPAARVPEPPPPTKYKDLITLGASDRGSPYHLRVVLDPRGAGVRSIVLNKFQAANDRGLPVWKQQEEGQPEPEPLELVPTIHNVDNPSFLLYHYDPRDSAEDRPLDTLGNALWKVVDGGLKSEPLADGRTRQQVAFEAEVEGVIVTKIYTLTEGEYHIGLEVQMSRKKGTDREISFRYQLTGAHGLPVEGKWYTNTFRNAMIGRVDSRGSVWRDLQDLRQMSQWVGGNRVSREEGRSIRYAAVALQYFTSAVAVDDDQKYQDFISQVRPTLESALRKGTIKSIADDHSSFVLTTTDNTDETFQVQGAMRLLLKAVKPGQRVAVLYHAGPYDDVERACPHVATEFRPFDSSHELWADDVTVRLSTEPVKLEPGKPPVSHKYVLYNGPVKVAQLYSENNVSPDLVQRYNDTLHLNTLTDYQSSGWPSWMGSFPTSIGWTKLIILCTNLMHTVLGWLYYFIPNYGLCILLLTIMVRAMMFPFSRKQALTSMRMQQLAPELKKLQEKHKDDRQAMTMAQMELYRRYGINPLGSCWVIFLQMPVFLGLYYALQESIHFRLAEFLWIKNLAAPDMLLSWSERIPIISRPENYGVGMMSMFYLGPYFNLLPVIAVILMIFQQKMMTPPPADEQQAMQMKLMRYMMIVIGLAFYKVAAGLCIYFIASSLWGFAERRLLPKRQLTPAPAGDGPGEGYLQRLLNRSTETLSGERASSSTQLTDGRGRNRPRSGRSRRRERERGRPAPEPTSSGWWQRARDWWEKVLEEARKK